MDETLPSNETPAKARLTLSRRRLASVAAATVVLAGAAVFALTAGGDDANGGSGGGATGSSNDAALQYAQCMRDNGIEDFPDPQRSDDGGISIGDAVEDLRDTEKFAAADTACQHILDAANPDAERLSPDEHAEIQEQWNAAAQCLRDQGYDFPTPEVDEWGRPQMDPLDAATEQALEQCLRGSGPDGPA